MWTITLFCLLVAACGALGASQDSAQPTYKPKCLGLHGPKNYPNPKQANTYFQCVFGRPVMLYCPSRQLFSAAKGQCEPIKDIDEYPDVDRDAIKCRFNGEYICNPLNPRSFYQCSHGVPYLHDCPADLVFHKFKRVCTKQAPVGVCRFKDCLDGQEYDPISEKCVLVSSDRCRDEQLPNGHYPDYTTSCEYYFRCQDGSQDGDFRKCPDGFRFDPRTMKCEIDLTIVCSPCGTKQC